MKLKTFYDLIRGKRDVRGLKVLNEILGKKCLFIEKPHINTGKIKKYLKKNKIDEIFILTPENYEDMIRPEYENITKSEFEKQFNEVVNMAKNKKIKLVLHVHLKKNTKDISFKEKLIRTKRALAYLSRCDVKVGFGWWRTSHDDPELKIVAKKLGLKLSKRRFHIYDSWLK